VLFRTDSTEFFSPLHSSLLLFFSFLLLKTHEAKVGGVGHGLDSRVGDMGEGGELGSEGLVEGDVGALVSDLVAVIGSREDGDTLAIVLHHVTLVLDLVTPDQQICQEKRN